MNYLSIAAAAAALSFAAISPLAQARVIGTAATVGAPNNVCRVLKYSPQKDLLELCTGSLTATNEVLTAAHCASDVGPGKNELLIQCGYQSSDPKAPNIDAKNKARVTNAHILNVKFAENFRVTEAPQISRLFKMPAQSSIQTADENDLARIRLPRASRFTPLTIGTLTAGAGMNCWTVGFGRADDHYSGIPHIAPLTDSPMFLDGNKIVRQTKVRTTSPAEYAELERVATSNSSAEEKNNRIIEIARKYGQIKALGMNGDSGGPLLCEIGGAKRALYGVSHVVAAGAQPLNDVNVGLTFAEFWIIPRN